MISLGSGVKTVEGAKEIIYYHKLNFRNSTLVLFVPTEAQLLQFDGYCVMYQNCEVLYVCAYQCKANNSGADGKVPEWITQGGHLLRSNAPQSCKILGRNAKGWTYYNVEETDEFLG